ncbi:hypothetical protein [Planobispora takensis]|uniref:Uncharacterized protein n=1 Tax=Planobispora takensis TaxID=1367882 RepID=A0A8J3T019_9ACTN|nr:hypothetical protein [Planobispora takensis]GII03602.1 hypothetical protein Pta02_56100 [Planobispora takensis]
MDVPDPDALAELMTRVRRLLAQTGLADERAGGDGGYGVRVRHDPDRGVVVDWSPADPEGKSITGVGSRYPAVRIAVYAAVMGVLTEAGYCVVHDSGQSGVCVLG